MKFLLDNNLPPKLVRESEALASPDHEVVHFRDRFAPETEDSAWMSELESDVVIVSGDLRIGKNPHEVQAWKESGHTIFFLKSGWAELPFEKQTRKLVKCLPEMATAAAQADPGASFEVSKTGKLIHTRP
ncbi:MAG: hypothetical protein JWR69_2814 [Pedosphaera sp.]|nr:hypothetical protein [Pedosphaera sp.]